MLHILFMILKIIGIIVAVVLGLLLFIVCLVLFVPVRYSIHGKKEEDILLNARMSWLLHLLHIRLIYFGKSIRIKLYVLGICVYDNQRKAKNKKSKKSKKKKDVNTKVIEKEPVLTNSITKTEAQKTEDKASYAKPQQPEVKEKRHHPLRKLIDKIKRIWNAIVTFFKNIARRKSLILQFLEDEINKKGISICFKSLFAALQHIRPQKLKGYIYFGTGDPCKTGQILGLASIFYGWYGSNISLQADFENSIFEADVSAKGRIRMSRLLIIAVKLKRDQNFNKLIKSAKKLKEEL